MINGQNMDFIQRLLLITSVTCFLSAPSLANETTLLCKAGSGPTFSAEINLDERYVIWGHPGFREQKFEVKVSDRQIGGTYPCQAPPGQACLKDSLDIDRLTGDFIFTTRVAGKIRWYKGACRQSNLNTLF